MKEKSPSPTTAPTDNIPEDWHQLPANKPVVFTNKPEAAASRPTSKIQVSPGIVVGITRMAGGGSILQSDEAISHEQMISNWLHFASNRQKKTTAPTDNTKRGIDLSTSKDDIDKMSEVDAKIAASEARTDTKFAQLMGELSTMRAEINGRLDVLGTRVEHVEKSTAGTKTTIIVTAIAAIGLTASILAYGGQWFGLGMDAQQVADRAVQSSTQNLQPQINSLANSNVELNAKIDTLIRGLNNQMMGSDGPLPAPYQEPKK